MLLPPENSITPPPESNLVSDPSQLPKIDKALLAREIIRHTASILPDLLRRQTEVALSPSSKDSDALAAISDLLDRSAGKATQVIEHQGDVGLYSLPPEEVQKRLLSLQAP